MIRIVYVCNIASYLSEIILNKRKIEEEEQRKLELEKRRWESALMIQKAFSIYHNRVKSPNEIKLRRFANTIFQKTPHLKLEAQESLKLKMQSLQIILTFIRDIKNAPLALVRSFQSRVKAIQKYARALKMLNEARVLLLRAFVDAFHPQLMIHINIILAGKSAFDHSTGEREIALVRYLNYSR
jgi:hypothetical protein